MPPRSDEPSRPWQTLSAERPVVTNWFAVRRDQVRTHTGDEISYTYVEHPGAIFIVPVTPHGEILLVRQFRYSVRAWCWETPAGSVQHINHPRVGNEIRIRDVQMPPRALYGDQVHGSGRARALKGRT